MQFHNTLLVFVALANWVGPAQAQTPLLEAMVKATECRTNSNEKIRQVPSLNLVCLKGAINHAMSITFRELNLAKDFSVVVNSGGGDAESALDISDIILAQGAHVIVDNVCLSSCANYLFLSGKTKVVLPRSLLMWHGGPLHVVSPIVIPSRRQRIVDLADRSDKFFIKIGVIRDLIYFAPYRESGIRPKNTESWTASRKQLEEYYYVTGIEYMWEMDKDAEFIAARAAGQTPDLRLKIP